MEGRPPEVVDTANGENLKLACMACIRGHRTKHCGGHNCRDKILWTIKRPGRPSNSCMCKFSGTGRCKCVLAKAQCPHKPKKGEKKTVDCRCDERGRLCCTLAAPQWDMIAKGEKPGVKMYRNLEELHAEFSNRTILPGQGITTSLPQGFSPMSGPQTPATSVGGFTNGTGSTPQTPLSVQLHPVGMAKPPSVPESPAARTSTRFGMMGIGAPMGSEGHIGEDVLSWQGQTPIAPAPRPSYATPPIYQQQTSHGHPVFSAAQNHPYSSTPYAFDNAISQPPAFSPQSQQTPMHSNPQTPLYQPQPTQYQPQHTFDTLPPVTASLNELSMAPSNTIPSLSGFDMDYFNFQFPGAICQQCGMANCTCRACPTVLQNTMDGSWRQCCSRKHVHFGPATATAPDAQAPKKSCCSSKTNGTPQPPSQQFTPSAAPSVSQPISSREGGGCCGGSHSQDRMEMDPFAFDSAPQPPSHPTTPFHDPSSSQYIPAFTPVNPAPGSDIHLFNPNVPPPPLHAEQALASNGAQIWPEQQQSGDIDMDFNEFIVQEMEGGGCGCGTDCPCGMDDGLDVDMEFETESGGDQTSRGGGGGGGCCGGGGGGGGAG